MSRSPAHDQREPTGTLLRILCCCVAWLAVSAATAPVKIMALGDSYTTGLHALPASTALDNRGGYRYKLCSKMQDASLNVHMVGSIAKGTGDRNDFRENLNEGHPGWVTDYSIVVSYPSWDTDHAVAKGLRQYIDGWQSTFTPDIIILFSGINDVFGYGITRQNSAIAQGALVDRIRSNNPNVVVYVCSHRWNDTVYDGLLTPIITGRSDYGSKVFLADFGTEPNSASTYDAWGSFLFDTIQANTPVPLKVPVVGATGLPYGRLTFTYAQNLTATYPVSSWAINSGALPTGLSLNSATGAITGTPSTEGVFTFTVVASNSGGASAPAAKNITIRSATYTEPVSSSSKQGCGLGGSLTGLLVLLCALGGRLRPSRRV
jgi:hypothetical protein